MELDLPMEVQLEIFSRLPLESVGKWRALSKSHEKASHHSYYKDLFVQRQHGPVLDGFIFQTISHAYDYTLSFVSPLLNSPCLHLSLSFLPGRHPRILAAAPNGLLLCETKHSSRRTQPIYSICKPSTKQYKGIPLPRTRFFSTNIAMFVLRSNPLHFKILRVSSATGMLKKRPPLLSIAVFELFDSETWRWKRLDDVVRDSESKKYDSRDGVVVASGSAHWKTNDEISIFAFHFESETWSKIMMPDVIIAENNQNTKLVEYEGKLGLMRKFQNGHATELWVMNNYANRIWTKKCDFRGTSMPMAIYGSDISMTCSGEMGFSNLETGSCRKMEQEYYYQPPRIVFPFLSDFESWSFQAPPRTLKPRTMVKILRKRLLLIQKNVDVLISFSLFFAHYNHCLSTILLGLLDCALQNL